MIKLNISPRIVPAIASLYNDVNRIFLEYIDNALDSAESYYDSKKNSYSKPIKIAVSVSGKSHNNGKVSIEDNCEGIDNLGKLLQKIGNSDKKAQPWTNGQFGYGIFSFMACCDKLNMKSKSEENPDAYSISVDRSKFETDNQSDVKFKKPKKVIFNSKSGTIATLSSFQKGMWKNINFDMLKSEIEKHFEMLLTRKNLEIVFKNGHKKYVCSGFNYDSIEGVEWKGTINKLTGKKSVKNAFDFDLSNEPIRIFLKLSNNIALCKPPVFIKSGRRIGAIKDIKSFRSKNKSSIWAHPRLTGYIDLGSFLQPTIARNDFKNNIKSKALFAKIQEIESEILKYIHAVNKAEDQKHYSAFEDKLNDILSSLAKEDAIKFRTDYQNGSEVTLNSGGANKNKRRGSSGKQTDLPEGDPRSTGSNPNNGNGNGTANSENTNPWADENHSGQEKKKSGVNIKINTHNTLNGPDGKAFRSVFDGEKIELFATHQDFNNRVEKSRSGEKRISQRLLTYIAGEVTVHYKDMIYNKGNSIPDYNKDMFIGVVDFIYQFEEKLKDLVGKNLANV